MRAKGSTAHVKVESVAIIGEALKKGGTSLDGEREGEDAQDVEVVRHWHRRLLNILCQSNLREERVQDEEIRERTPDSTKLLSAFPFPSSLLFPSLSHSLSFPIYVQAVESGLTRLVFLGFRKDIARREREGKEEARKSRKGTEKSTMLLFKLARDDATSSINTILRYYYEQEEKRRGNHGSRQDKAGQTRKSLEESVELNSSPGRAYGTIFSSKSNYISILLSRERTVAARHVELRKSTNVTVDEVFGSRAPCARINPRIVRHVMQSHTK